MGDAIEGSDLLSSVRTQVHKVLCSRDNLRIDSFQLSQRPLTRADKVCGWHFCLHGPRQLQLSAIWDIQLQTIWFYGSQGERFMTATAPCVA